MQHPPSRRVPLNRWPPVSDVDERWFAELTTKWTKRSTHQSVRDLVASIRTWITNWNDDPKPYVEPEAPQEACAPHEKRGSPCSMPSSSVRPSVVHLEQHKQRGRTEVDRQ